MNCKFRGEATGETTPCRVCRNNPLKVFWCEIFGKCTLNKPSKDPEIHMCHGCEKKECLKQ